MTASAWRGTSCEIRRCTLHRVFSACGGNRWLWADVGASRVQVRSVDHFHGWPSITVVCIARRVILLLQE